MRCFFKPPISISYAPNVEGDDVRLATKLFMGWEKTDKKTVGFLEKAFKKRFKVKYSYAFSSGRAAFYYILKSLNFSPGDEVLIQAFTCVAVPNAVLWAGLKPVYVDIDKNTFNLSSADLEKKITSRSKAVVIQHTFGIPANIESIIKIARKHNLFIIEDCAHSLGASYKNKEVGTHGDMAFFSFGRDKVLSSVFGGMAITKNKSFAKRLKGYNNLLINPTPSFINRQLLYPIIYSGLLPLYNIFIGKLLLKLVFWGRILSKAVYDEEKTGKMPSFVKYKLAPALAALALHQFEKIEKLNKHRRKIAAIYSKILLQDRLFNKEFTEPIFLRYPVLTTEKNRLLQEAKQKGIHLGNWYNTPITPINTDAGGFNYRHGSCPTAEFVCDRVVNLPTHINITTAQAHAVALLVKKYLTNDG